MFLAEIFLFLCLCKTCEGKQSFSDVRKIIIEKIKPGSRSTYIRPAINQSLATDTSIYIDIQDFQIHDTENKLKVRVLFSVWWKDETISLEPPSNNSYYYQPVVFMKEKELSVWYPTIILRNTFGQTSYLGSFSKIYGMVVYDDKIINMLGFHEFKSECEVDMTYFPFDTQVCSFKITGRPSEIFFSWGMCIMENTNSEWVNANVNYTLSDTSLTCTIKATRKPTFLIMNLIVPVALIGFLNVFVFIVPANAGEKLQYCVSILLSFNVYLGILVDNVPANSEKMSLLSYFIIYQYLFGVVVIAVTAALLRTVHGNDSRKVPRKFHTVVKIADYVKCKKKCLLNRARVRNSEAYSEGNSTAKSNVQPEVTWKSVCSACDFFLFWLFLFVQITGNLYFFLSLQ